MRVILLGIEDEDYAWEVLVAAAEPDGADYHTMVDDDYPYSVASIVADWKSDGRD